MQHLTDEAIAGADKETLHMAIKDHLKKCPDCQEHHQQKLAQMEGGIAAHKDSSIKKEMPGILINKLRTLSRYTLIFTAVLAACAPAAARSSQGISPATADTGGNSQGDSTATVGLSLSNLPFVPLLPRDGIAPIYEPEFVSAEDSSLHDDELIMGVAIEGEAKAYPVTVLRFREMVNDELAGWPILVTW